MILNQRMLKSPLKRWVGGKSRIDEFILRYCPTSFQDYHEPFLGSAAVFLALKQTIGGDRQWHLADANPHLICWWKILQSDMDALIREILVIKADYESNPDKKLRYHELRHDFNHHHELDVRKAALFTFLCRTAFNGLVRYNSKGQFNSAYGAQKSGIFKDSFHVDFDHLEKIHEIIKENTHFKCQSYEHTLMKPSDFGFFDPPYVPSAQNKMIDQLSYCKDGFSTDDQILFAHWCQKQHENNSLLMVCNHSTDFIQGLFHNFKFVPYDLMKNFSGDHTARIRSTEALICNYV